MQPPETISNLPKCKWTRAQAKNRENFISVTDIGDVTMVHNNVYCNGQTIRTGQSNMLTEQIMTISDYQIIIENTEIILNETTVM